MERRETIELLRNCLQTEQMFDGAFVNLRSIHSNDFSHAEREVTTFFTSQILALSSDLLTASNREEAIGFLRRQIHPKAGTFNYWPRGSDASRNKPYPDDHDDTACGWLALGRMDGTELGMLTGALIATESGEGGPYRTWLVPESADPVWLDTDVAVNANIATLLASQDIHLAGLDRFLDEAIDAEQLRSPYYPDAIPVLYFLTRARAGEKCDRLIEHWMSLKQGEGWGDAIRTAMAISSLKRLGVTVDASAWLSKPEEMILPYAFCIDPADQGRPTYAGSAGLTAAFCYEAIRSMEVSLNVETETKSVEESVHEVVVARAIRLVGDVALLGEDARKVIEKMSVKDTRRQITLTPYRLSQALGRDHVRDLSIKAGVGSLFGWAAYTLYDDVWDGDAESNVLPLANLFHRRMSEEFSEIAPDRAFNDWWKEMLDQVDSANAWEMMHCRVRISNGSIELPMRTPVGLDAALVGRSIGHVIGPGVVLQTCGWETTHPAFLSVIEIYRAYILARQLHDDAHDWEADLKRGQLNAASFAIIEAWKGPRDVLLDEFLPIAREIFWMQVIPVYTERIIGICEEAKAVAKSIGDLKNPEQLISMFDVPLAGARQALTERERTLEFLKALPS